MVLCAALSGRRGGMRLPPSSQVVWLCLRRGPLKLFGKLASASSVFTMGRRNKPTQGDPEPLFEDQPSSSKVSKRKAGDEGKQFAKKAKSSTSKGKGKQVPAPGGVRVQKRARKAVAVSKQVESHSPTEDDGNPENNLEAHKKYRLSLSKR